MKSDKNLLKAETFKKYVNTFFLWDYVDENYSIRTFFSKHSIQNKKPDTTEEVIEMLQVITNAIVRRGYFMVVMLKITNKYSEKYEQILSEITSLEKSDMESAIEIIKRSTNRDTEILEVLSRISHMSNEALELPRSP